MKRIINIITDFSKTHKKSLVIFTSVLISLGVICGIFIYNIGVRKKKEKELLSRIDNLEEQIKREDISAKDESDANNADAPNKETETDSTDISPKEEVETQINNSTTNEKEETTKGSNENKTEDVETNTESSGNTEASELVVLGRDGIKGINYSRFGECFTVISLTIDNWSDYIDVLTYNKGIVPTEIVEETVLVAKTDKYYRFEKFLIQLKNNETGEIILYAFNDDCWGQGDKLPKDFNLKNYECVGITGKIYFVNIPEEVIYTPLPHWGYACGFVLITPSYSTEKPYKIQSETRRIYTNGGSEDWEIVYMK